MFIEPLHSDKNDQIKPPETPEFALNQGIYLLFTWLVLKRFDEKVKESSNKKVKYVDKKSMYIRLNLNIYIAIISQQANVISAQNSLEFEKDDDVKKKEVTIIYHSKSYLSQKHRERNKHNYN